MIFDYESVMYDLYLKKNKLEIINKKSKSYKEFLKNKNKDKYSFIKKYTKNTFDEKYVRNICKNKKNKFLFFCIDSNINYLNIPSMLIYRKIFNQKDKVRFALLLIVTLEDYRSLGYGETLIYEFIDKIKVKNKKTEIVLHSLRKSQNF